jgi:hypothetical protein
MRPHRLLRVTVVRGSHIRKFGPTTELRRWRGSPQAGPPWSALLHERLTGAALAIIVDFVAVCPRTFMSCPRWRWLCSPGMRSDKQPGQLGECFCVRKQEGSVLHWSVCDAQKYSSRMWPLCGTLGDCSQAWYFCQCFQQQEPRRCCTCALQLPRTTDHPHKHHHHHQFSSPHTESNSPDPTARIQQRERVSEIYNWLPSWARAWPAQAAAAIWPHLGHHIQQPPDHRSLTCGRYAANAAGCCAESFKWLCLASCIAAVPSWGRLTPANLQSGFFERVPYFLHAAPWLQALCTSSR